MGLGRGKDLEVGSLMAGWLSVVSPDSETEESQGAGAVVQCGLGADVPGGFGWPAAPRMGVLRWVLGFCPYRWSPQFICVLNGSLTGLAGGRKEGLRVYLSLPCPWRQPPSPQMDPANIQPPWIMGMCCGVGTLWRMLPRHDLML